MEPFIYWSFFAKTDIKDQQNGPQYGNLIFEGPIHFKMVDEKKFICMSIQGYAFLLMV